MSYVHINHKTKKAFKDSVQAGTPNRLLAEPIGIRNPSAYNGEAFIEGPHSPQPHRWYARVEVKDGIVVEVK